MPKKILVSLILLITTSLAVAQNPSDPKPNEQTEKLRKDAVEFLRETSEDVGRMRSIENRISFGSELASLMWFHDEKEAKAMYLANIADFKQLLMQFDAQMNMLDAPVDDDSYSGGIFGGYARSPVERKFRIAMAVRQQIAMSLAEHDAEIAYNFFYDSAGLISNPQFRKETEQSDKNFEFQLMKQIAETNAAKAVVFGSASLKDGVDGNHVELLKKIYAKDADKGIEFGSAILSQLKSDKKGVKGLNVFGSLLSYGAENLEASQKTGGKKAIYSRGELRDIADQFARVLLEDSDEDTKYSAIGYADQIEKFAPGRGTQIKAKFRSIGNSNVKEMRLDRMTALSTNTVTVYGTGSGRTDSNSDTAASQENLEREAREKIEKQMMEDVKKLGSPLPKDERQKIVAQARKIISQTPGKDKKLIGLNLLAAQVARAGDKELAGEIMRDAERLVNPQPKNYRDFIYTWMLASGYAQSNPERAFPLLEDTILRANETISAFVRVAEFIDVNEEMIVDGEVQVGMFGGSMMRGMTQGLGLGDSTLIELTKADFAKTKSLANSFDRIEVRVLAKMLILRAVLDDKKSKIAELTESAAEADSTAPPPPVAVPRRRPN